MRLTDKEMEIMGVLWGSNAPLTATEIVEFSENKTWKEKSIYTLMNTLIKKGAVILSRYKPTATNNARAYKPALTSEECAVLYIEGVRKSGIKIDLQEFVNCLMKTEKEQ